MKKSIKSILAKSLAVAMAFSLAGIAPSTSSDAAAAPALTKKVTVTVGKTKTVKVTSKKKVKSTTWSLSKKVATLSKKKAKSVVVKGKKKGTATLTAKIKVGRKTYKKTCKITVKGAAKPKVTPVPTPVAPTPVPTEKPVDKIPTANGVLTVDEAATYPINLTSLNETTFTSADKRDDGEEVADGTTYHEDGSVSFTSTKDYNSGVSYYINPCTSEDQIIDISDTRGDGFRGYDDGTKDVSDFDYIRVKLTSANEMNLRTYNGNDQLRSAGFPGSATSETYEGNWAQAVSEKVWEDESAFSNSMSVKEDYLTRTVFIPLSMLADKGMDPATLTAIAFCPQSEGVEVVIHRVDLVKVKYDKKVSGIEVKANKTEIVPGKTANLTATVAPADATRQTVKWSSSDESIATVNYAGVVVAGSKTGEVTITATATDGSGVTGSIKIKVADPAEAGEVKTHKVDLTKVVANSNIYPKQQEFVPVVATAESINFEKGCKMMMVDLSQYLADNKLELSNYDEIQVAYQMKNADGTNADSNPSTWDNAALVKKDDLNGYTNPGVLKGTFGNRVADTAVFKLKEANLAELSTAAGFNFQLEAMDEDKYMAITGITLYKA